MQLHKNQFLTPSLEPDANLLRIDWTDDTAGMKDADFRDALDRFASHAAGHGAQNLLVDVRQFKFDVPEATGAWRQAEITPRYNQAAVRKFAYILPDAAPLPPEQPASPNGGGDRFATRFFHDEDAAKSWFAEG